MPVDKEKQNERMKKYYQENKEKRAKDIPSINVGRERSL